MSHTQRTRLNFLRWLPAAGMMALIFFFSSQPASSLPDFGLLDLGVKKTGHLVAYALLALAYLFALNKSLPRAAQVAWLLSFLFALSDEVHQSFVPGRSPSALDVGIDMLGASLALWLASGRPR